MKANIRYFDSPDIVGDFTSWQPEKSSFAVLIDILIGPENSEGEESFSVIVCSPDWLAQEANARGIVDGRHIYVVNTWNWSSVRQYFENRVTEYSADDWPALALLLSRIGAWEFEDYKERLDD